MISRFDESNSWKAELLISNIPCLRSRRPRAKQFGFLAWLTLPKAQEVNTPDYMQPLTSSGQEAQYSTGSSEPLNNGGANHEYYSPVAYSTTSKDYEQALHYFDSFPSRLSFDTTDLAFLPQVELTRDPDFDFDSNMGSPLAIPATSCDFPWNL